MRKNTIVGLAMLLVLSAMLITVSCAKKAVETSPDVMAKDTGSAESTMEEPTAMRGDADSNMDRVKAAEIERQQELERQRQAMMDKFINEDVHFEFDSAVLLPEAQQVLRSKADFLNANMNSVTIEGHCDARGTDAYNMALGERRAEAAKAYLVNLGIADNRISTISYGEERPVDPGTSEAAYAKNRRAHVTLN